MKIGKWVSALPTHQMCELVEARIVCNLNIKGLLKVEPNSIYQTNLCEMMMNDISMNSDDERSLTLPQSHSIITSFMNEIYLLPMWFLAMVTGASEILGYYHPNKDAQACWRNLYLQILGTMHLEPETKEMLINRFNSEEV